MTKRLQITPLAERDLEELARHIALDSVQTAQRFQQAAIQTGFDLLEFPEAYAVIDLEAAQQSAMRKRCVQGFHNHLIFYTVSTDAVTIQRFIHSARDLPVVLREESEEE